MAKILTEYGITKYLDDNGRLHREDGPAYFKEEIIRPSFNIYKQKKKKRF